MTIQDMQQRALTIAQKYDELNQTAGRKIWSTSEFMAGFVGDVGDLSKLVMAKNGYREITDIDAKLAHELSDCLWSVLVLAAKLDIDIEKAFAATMRELDARLAAE